MINRCTCGNYVENATVCRDCELEALRNKVAALQKQLDRYTFDECRHTLDRERKTFAAEINSCHPVNSADPESDERYELALKLVGERHDKYELVDLVNWLITDRDRTIDATRTLNPVPDSGK